MLKRLSFLLIPLLFASGCASTEPFEEQIRSLKWDLDAAEQRAEQATVDKSLAEREVTFVQKDARILQERLALAYDALRVARTKLDEGLQDRLTELSQATVSPGQRLEISQYGGVVLSSGVLFTPGKDVLSKGGKAALQPLVATLLQKKYDGYEIELAGHTDSDPIKRTKRRYRDNWDLASMRANSVRRFLITAGIPSGRIYLSSWGSIHPFAKGEKAENRRVEIMLRKKTDALPASSPREE